MNPTHAISPLDDRYFNKISKLSSYFSEVALFKYRIKIEIFYLLFLSKKTNILGKISLHEENLLTKIVEEINDNDFSKIKSYEETTSHDVKAMEYFLKEKLGSIGLSRLNNWIHFGLTSEDVNNLAYGLLISDFKKELYLVRLKDLISFISVLASEYEDLVMLGRTHGQPAVPTTFGKELAVFAYRLKRKLIILQNLKLAGKLNGAVGNYNALVYTYPAVNWLKISREFVENLDLSWNPLTTQIEPADSLVELFTHIRHINLILIGLCQDLWRYISDGYLTLKKNEAEAGSSTMPQKVNPLDFENAEGNLEIANSLFELFSRKLPISRLQRDLSDSTVKRNIGVAFGHTILAFKSIESGLGKIIANGEKMREELNYDWSIWAEAVQITLKAKGYERSYELIKDLTRGVRLGEKEYKKMIKGLQITDSLKQKLMSLTPEKYVGLAKELVEVAIKAE